MEDPLFAPSRKLAEAGFCSNFARLVTRSTAEMPRACQAEAPACPDPGRETGGLSPNIVIRGSRPVIV